MGVYIKDFSGNGISDGNGINFMVFRTYGGDLRVRNNETGGVFDAISVPPHGRLIDADALSRTKGVSNVAIGYINKAPTIIPAEE